MSITLTCSQKREQYIALMTLMAIFVFLERNQNHAAVFNSARLNEGLQLGLHDTRATSLNLRSCLSHYMSIFVLEM